ncbi:hypothetical protein EVAR_99081_1 [Eumeta japonica]|uniref:Uncharacterized protein n=1 Tax=Eumeta variegata TaxID=151549 RepID=A0A4C1ZNH6_EUMVA|nr:hypothetical protein EVAR_99081_1 [Eumeta japonica]
MMFSDPVADKNEIKINFDVQRAALGEALHSQNHFKMSSAVLKSPERARAVDHDRYHDGGTRGSDFISRIYSSLKNYYDEGEDRGVSCRDSGQRNDPPDFTTCKIYLYGLSICLRSETESHFNCETILSRESVERAGGGPGRVLIKFRSYFHMS